MPQRLSSLVCFLFPGAVLLFLISGPHDSAGALAWTLPLWLMVAADWLSPKIKPRDRHIKQPSSDSTAAYYNGILYCLAFIQFCNIGFMLIYAEKLQWGSPAEITTSLVNLVVVRILVGTSSGSSGIIVAHELIHRSNRQMQRLGRLIMCTVCYEHFVIAHKYGHHSSVAKPNDIATARRGEGYEAYCRRVYRQHFVYSWRFEQNRLGIADKPWQIKIVYNRALQGLLVEWLFLVLVVMFFGWVAAAIFLYQSYSAIRLLEAINYFQHWGLSEQKTRKTLAWVNDSWLTRYALLGLSCHVDHHENTARHFQDIDYSEQGPKMPYGYFVMNLWVKLGNRSYQRMAKSELERFEVSQPV